MENNLNKVLENKNPVSKLIEIKMNNYERIQPQVIYGGNGKYITNGVNNSFFYDIERKYISSCTNTSIIDYKAKLIYGKGLKGTYKGRDINDVISPKEVRDLTFDLPLSGNTGLQTEYTKANNGDIAKLYSIKSKCLAFGKDYDYSKDRPVTVAYCYDWNSKNKFKVQEFAGFGYSENYDTEIMYIKVPSVQPIFSLPDYFACFQYIDIEQEMSNYFLNHTINRFQPDRLININTGGTVSDEDKKEYKNAILKNTTSTKNAGLVLVSVNESKDTATTVEDISSNIEYDKLQTLIDEARLNIMLAHKVPDPSLFGLPNPTGFASQADQSDSALRRLYRTQILPYREIILDAFRELGITDVEFDDYDEIKALYTEEFKVDPTVGNGGDINI